VENPWKSENPVGIARPNASVKLRDTIAITSQNWLNATMLKLIKIS